MTPTCQYPRIRHHFSLEKQLPKGDYHMARKLSIAAALIVCTVSWAWADGFRVIADAPLSPPTPLYVSPGTLVKAEFNSPTSRRAPEAAEEDRTVVEAAAVEGGPSVKPRPAVAFRERPSGTMAPPPSNKPVKDTGPSIAASTEETPDSLEADLEKDLVLTPPTPKKSEKLRQEKELAEQGSTKETPASSEIKAAPKKPLQRVKKVTPSAEQTPSATASKPIRKVKPITQNFWRHPAGASPMNPVVVEPPSHARQMVARPQYPSFGPDGRSCPPDPDYVSAERPRVAEIPPSADRFVRDGVTIKLAPPVAGARPQPDDSGDDIFSAAAEILGLPFAFISSLF